MKYFWKLFPNAFVILSFTPQYSHAPFHKLHLSLVSPPRLTLFPAVAFHLSWCPCRLHAEMIGCVKWKAMGTLHGMGTVVAVAAPWSWSPLLAQCTHPPAVVGWQLTTHSCPLLLCAENCLWLNQERPCPVGLPQDETNSAGSSHLWQHSLWRGCGCPSLSHIHVWLFLCPTWALTLLPEVFPQWVQSQNDRRSFRQLWRRSIVGCPLVLLKCWTCLDNVPAREGPSHFLSCVLSWVLWKIKKEEVKIEVV